MGVSRGAFEEHPISPSLPRNVVDCFRREISTGSRPDPPAAKPPGKLPAEPPAKPPAKSLRRGGAGHIYGASDPGQFLARRR